MFHAEHSNPGTWNANILNPYANKLDLDCIAPQTVSVLVKRPSLSVIKVICYPISPEKGLLKNAFCCKKHDFEYDQCVRMGSEVCIKKRKKEKKGIFKPYT